MRPKLLSAQVPRWRMRKVWVATWVTWLRNILSAITDTIQQERAINITLHSGPSWCVWGWGEGGAIAAVIPGLGGIVLPPY